jgi:hypothetical protein
MICEAKVYGTDGTLAFTGAATTTIDPQSISVTDEFDIAEARNKVGDVKTRSAHNRRHTISVQILWRDAGGSPTQATAKSAVKFPGMLGLVTLAAFGNSLLDGDWNYDGGSAEYTNDGYCSGTFKLSRYGDTPASLAAVATS